MRIAVFHNLPSGGAKRALFEWTRRLAESHSIDCYTLSTSDPGYCDIRPHTEHHFVEQVSPNRLFKSPFGRLNQFQRWRDLVSIEQIHRRIAESVRSRSYDVIFANTSMFTYVPAFLQFCEIPSVYYLHEPFGRAFIRSFNRPYIANSSIHQWLNKLDPLIHLYQRKLSSIQVKSLQGTTQLLSNSRFTRDKMLELFKVDSAICPYGVDINLFRPIDGVEKSDYVVSVGEMTPRKGFDFIVEGLGRIPESDRPRLRVASNYVDKGELDYVMRLAEKAGVDLKVFVDQNTEQLRLLYNQARLCVYTPVQEPFGLVPLESMACGTPVIGVKEGGVQESVLHEQTGLLVERDQELFSEAIQKLLSDRRLADSYGRKGRKHVLDNWTWEKSVSNLTAYFERLC